MINKVILIGRLVANPELRFSKSGTAICSFRIATSERWKDKQGQQQEQVEFHQIEAWGKLAEICGEYLSKGSQVYLEGSLKTDKWQDKSGNNRYTTKIRAREMRMLSPKNSNQEAGEDSRPGVRDVGEDAPF